MKKLILFFTLVNILSNKVLAQNTYVPDNIFESYLISEGFDTGPTDNYVPTANLLNVTSIDLSWSFVSDLTGIEDCINLTSLNIAICSGITSIDISANTALTFLDCSATQITSLNVTQNINLESLAFVDDFLDTIDVSQNIALSSLQCANNQIANLDLSNNLLLTSLYCSDNVITGLDLSLQPNLTEIICANNNLSYLRVNNGNNQNVSNNDFYVIGNPNLECIVVDSVEWSALNWINIDAQSSFNDTCYYLEVEELNALQITVFPNPAADIVNVISGENARYKITMLHGQSIMTGQLFVGYNNIGIQQLSPGIYLLSIETESAKIVKRLMVK